MRINSLWRTAAFVLVLAWAGATNAPTADLFRTGFEATGDPDQVYLVGESLKTKANWTFLDPDADPGLAVITDAEAFEGSQSLQLSQGAAVDRTIEMTPENEVVWIQAYFKGPGSPATVPTYPPSPPASSIVHFSAINGIQLLDGDGAGDGTWVQAADHDEIAPDAWYQITLRQDYASKTWDCYVNGEKQNDDALGFRDNAVARLNGFMNLSDTTSFLDNIWVRLAQRGDANGDLKIDSSDLVRTIMIANTPTPPLALIWGGNADVSGPTGEPDGIVDSFDVMAIANLILGF